MNKTFKYRFFLEAPKSVQIGDQVYELGDKYGVDLEFLGEEEGVIRKTVFFMAYGESQEVIEQFAEAVKTEINENNNVY